MTALYELRARLRALYAENDDLIRMILKGIFALALFLTTNLNLGFRPFLKDILLNLVASLLCAILPARAIPTILSVFLIWNFSAVSLEITLILVVFLFLILWVFQLFHLKQAVWIAILYLMGMWGLPTAMLVPLAFLMTPTAIFSVVFGYALNSFVHFMKFDYPVLFTGDVKQNLLTKLGLVLDGVFANNTLILYSSTAILVVFLVYYLRRASFRNSRLYAILAGSFLCFLIPALSMLLRSYGFSLLLLGLDCLVGLFLSFVVWFFLYSLDYAHTIRTQFEDEEYYYYVKAVPKVMVAPRRKRVTKISEMMEKEAGEAEFSDEKREEEGTK